MKTTLNLIYSNQQFLFYKIIYKIVEQSNERIKDKSAKNIFDEKLS